MYDIKIDVTGKGQYTASTCWLACYRILYAWKRADDSTIPVKIAGASLDYKAMSLRGVYPEEFVQTGTALGMSGRAAIEVKGYDFDAWEDRLRKYGPHWVATQKLGSGHAIVVHGVDKDLNQLLVHDPYNRFQPGTVESAFWTLPQMQERLAIYPFAVQVWS